jgi:hypothetical protein
MPARAAPAKCLQECKVQASKHKNRAVLANLTAHLQLQARQRQYVARWMLELVITTSSILLDAWLL